jgi:purine-binding chemotaxis protein CheW
MDQVKKTAIQDLQAVVFMLNKAYYGVPILQVQEIVKMTEITELPNTPDFVQGIVNLRGKIIPIIDMRKRFGLPEETIDENWKILILKEEDVLFGVMVDQISEVEKVPATLIEKPPKIVAGVNGKFINGIAKTENRLLILLDIAKILSDEEKELLQDIENI